jgi:hypothetical protein
VRVLTLFSLLVCSLVVGSIQSLPSPTAAQDGKKMPETIILSKEAKLGGMRRGNGVLMGPNKSGVLNATTSRNHWLKP